MRTLLHRASGAVSLAGAALVVIATTLPASSFVVRGGHSGGHMIGRFGGIHFKSGATPAARIAAAHGFFFGFHNRRFQNQFFGAFGFPFFGWNGFGWNGFGWNGGYSVPVLSNSAPGESGADQPYATSGIATGGSPPAAGGWRGDCTVHELIYGDDGRFVGQKVVEACN
jgi:hypothetical protein